MRFKKLPDLEYLREILDYDPETGVFTWKKKIASRQYIGEEAGHVDNKGYLVIGISKQNYKAHRLAYYYVTGCDPRELQIDHADRDKLNNSFSNLRLANNSGNMHNRGLTGVHFHKLTQKWQASITHDNVRHYLGLFANVFDALVAYYTKKNELCITQN